MIRWSMLRRRSISGVHLAHLIQPHFSRKYFRVAATWHCQALATSKQLSYYWNFTTIHPKQHSRDNEYNDSHHKQAASIVVNVNSQLCQMKKNSACHQAQAKAGTQPDSSRNQEQHGGNQLHDSNTNAAPWFHLQGGEDIDRFRMRGEFKIQGLQQYCRGSNL